MSKFSTLNELSALLSTDVNGLLKEDFGNLIGAALFGDDDWGENADVPSEEPEMQPTDSDVENYGDLSTMGGENTPSAAQDPGSSVVSKVASMTILKATGKTADGHWDYAHKAVQPFGYSDYGGVCARGTAQILNQVFNISDYANGGIGDGGVNVASNPHFKKVASVVPAHGFKKAKPGDVAVFRGKMHAAVCLDGQTWASDTIQRNLDCYNGSCPRADIYRYVGDKKNKRLAEDCIIDEFSSMLNEGFGELLGSALFGDDTSSLPSLPSVGDKASVNNPVQLSTPNNTGAVPNINMSQTQVHIMERLMKDLGWPKCSAAAMLGIIQSESGCNPKAVNKAEKNGTNQNSSAALGARNNPDRKTGMDAYSYGAGLVQWSHVSRKSKVLGLIGKDINYLKQYGIESLSLDEQITMIEKEMQTTFSNVCATLAKCRTSEDATKMLYYRYVGGSSNKAEMPSEAELNAMVRKYVGANQGTTWQSHLAGRIDRAKGFENLV